MKQSTNIETRSPSSVRVGLFLGMGSIAGADFYKKFEESFVGKPDHEHPIVVCYSNPTMPRKDAGVEGKGTDPLPALREGMDFFKNNNVDFVMAPCNTLMFYREKLQAYSGLRILDIIEEVAHSIHKNFPDIGHIGLMSTAATRMKGMYHQALGMKLKDVKIVELDELNQAEVAKAIEEVKCGLHTQNEMPKQRLINAARYLAGKGAQIVIEGCTELPCALDPKAFPEITLIDSSLILAQAGVREINKLKKE